MINNIAKIIVYLDKKSAKCTIKVFKCGHIISVYQYGNMVKKYQQLLDGTEYASVDTLIADVAKGGWECRWRL